ncbi:acetyl-CoA carboxylase biotin carboxyl carrier protein subunit [Candidatus Bathyarchaeota archaeon]|nr:acetyl-CoA carboxylase biotin carboxyl carrier protein subunit [Candidatus Bathyarchaeota archaeon]
MSDKESTQAHAYTPGLKVKRSETIIKERRLPIPGEILVKEGDSVIHDTIVARTFISGDPTIVKVAIHLNILADEIGQYMVKKIGDPVKKGEDIAVSSSFFGLFKNKIPSPVNGIIESISQTTGQVIIRGDPIPIHLNAYVPGKVHKTTKNEIVTIQTRGVIIQGIFGIGGEIHGPLKIKVNSNAEKLDSNMLSAEDKGCILVVGSLVTLDALRKAVEIGVNGIIAGGVGHIDLKNFMGRDLGVAITGQEGLGITLIITEGFGQMNMSEVTFNLLKDFDGILTHINGTTQIRAGVMRPEIIIPHEQTYEEKSEELASGMVIGTPIRIIREPYFGEIAKVSSLPVNLMQLESESYVRVLEAQLNDGSIVTIPRANAEIIEH